MGFQKEHGPDEATRTDATFDDEALSYDLDGEDGSDPDEWYIKTEMGTYLNTPSGAIDATASLIPEAPEEDPDQTPSDESDGALDGAVLMVRQKKREKKKVSESD
ncbi:hypothetical protein PInf_022163 [Phytophthora infestans]|nr:hypothetical protein PInf_022163 [Phytophthora infestans]